MNKRQLKQDIKNSKNDKDTSQEHLFFKIAIETVGAIVLVMDLHGRIIFVNGGCEDALLLPTEKINGNRLWQFISDEDKQTVKSTFKGVVETGFKRQIEISWISKYSISRLFSCSIGVIRDLNGKTSNVVLTGVDITERNRAEEQLKSDAEKFRDMFISTIHVLSTVGEKRDPYTAGHQSRVAELAAAIGTEMGVDPDRVEGIFLGGLIHDIGKISVPSDIINRPGRLNKMEYGLIQYHTSVGFDIVKELELPWPIKEMIVQHHERLDGSGYPDQLKGDEIILEARVIAVADVVEAISSHRPYRAALGIETGLKEIWHGRGIIFDKDAVDACLTLFKEDRFKWQRDPMTSHEQT